MQYVFYLFFLIKSFFIVGGEKVLLNHKQEALADHVNPAEVLKSLNIEVPSISEEENSPK